MNPSHRTDARAHSLILFHCYLFIFYLSKGLYQSQGLKSQMLDVLLFAVITPCFMRVDFMKIQKNNLDNQYILFNKKKPKSNSKFYIKYNISINDLHLAYNITISLSHPVQICYIGHVSWSQNCLSFVMCLVSCVTEYMS